MGNDNLSLAHLLCHEINELSLRNKLHRTGEK